jgi:uncharacterized membrane protein YcaP (DUF421 family)
MPGQQARTAGRSKKMTIDWSELFSLTVSPVEIIVRGTAMYWFLVLLFRALLRRDTGSIAIADVLFLVIVADASQNAMSGDYKSITDGVILVATIAFWNFLADWLTYMFPALEGYMRPPPLALVRDGKIMHRNLRKEFLTEAELLGKVREQGCESLDEIKAAYMESDGQISVIKKK